MTEGPIFFWEVLGFDIGEVCCSFKSLNQNQTKKWLNFFFFSKLNQKVVQPGFGFRWDGRAVCPTLVAFLVPSFLEQYLLRLIMMVIYTHHWMTLFCRCWKGGSYRLSTLRSSMFASSLFFQQLVRMILWPFLNFISSKSGMLWLSYVTDNPDLCVAILSIRSLIFQLRW